MSHQTYLNGPVPQTVSIVYYNPSVTRPQTWAGERGRQLVESLERAGAHVTAIPAPPTAFGDDSDISSGRRARLLQKLSPRWRGRLIRLRLLQRGTVNTLRWSWRLWRELRSKPPDVLLARYHEFELTPLVVAGLLRRPLVLEVHAPFAVEEILRGGGPSRLAAWVDRACFRRADIVWVHTPELVDLVAYHVDEPARIRMIPFGVEDRGVVATPGDEGQRIDAVFVGSFYPWHGTEELLSALATARQQVPELHLTLIGDGVERAACEEGASRLGVSEHTSFPGWLSQQAVYEYLQRSHFGMAPYRETQYNYFEPVKILDYQMAGLPVVASAVGHIPRMVDHGSSGLLVPPSDSGALATAMVKLARNPGLRRDMGLVARRRASPIDDTARAVLEVCKSVAAGPQRR